MFAEQPSSSSMSTTTSSVTSMTSLEHSESASDYDPDHWDMTAWGEIDSSAGMFKLFLFIWQLYLPIMGDNFANVEFNGHCYSAYKTNLINLRINCNIIYNIMLKIINEVFCFFM